MVRASFHIGSAHSRALSVHNSLVMQISGRASTSSRPAIEHLIFFPSFSSLCKQLLVGACFDVTLSGYLMLSSSRCNRNGDFSFASSYEMPVGECHMTSSALCQRPSSLCCHPTFFNSLPPFQANLLPSAHPTCPLCPSLSTLTHASYPPPSP